MKNLLKYLEEKTGKEFNHNELLELINIVVNPHFETFEKVTKEDFEKRDFTLYNEKETETQFRSEFGYTIFYDFKNNLLTIFDGGENKIIDDIKICSKHEFDVIMDGFQLYLLP